MSEILFVPKWSISPAGCSSIPAVKIALDELRRRFDVQIFTWPTVKGQASVSSGWRESAAAIREAVQPGRHLVAMAPSPVAICMMALDGLEGGLSFVAPGIVYPTATMRSFGVDTLADAVEAQGRFGSNFPWVKESMEGTHDDEQRRYSELLDSDIDWLFENELLESFRSIDLNRQVPNIAVPVLYLDLPYFEYREYPLRESFLGFVPHAECGALQSWPLRMHLDEAGHEFVGTVSGFLDRVDAGLI